MQTITRKEELMVLLAELEKMYDAIAYGDHPRYPQEIMDEIVDTEYELSKQDEEFLVSMQVKKEVCDAWYPGFHRASDTAYRLRDELEDNGFTVTLTTTPEGWIVKAV